MYVLHHHHHHCHHWHDSPLWALAFLGFLNYLIFKVWGCQPHAQPSTWRTRVSLFLWLILLDLSGLGGSTSSFATAGIALRVSGALRPHHDDKVGIASMGLMYVGPSNITIVPRVSRFRVMSQMCHEWSKCAGSGQTVLLYLLFPTRRKTKISSSRSESRCGCNMGCLGEGRELPTLLFARAVIEVRRVSCLCTGYAILHNSFC
jgi:hypothetical protein